MQKQYLKVKKQILKEMKKGRHWLYSKDFKPEMMDQLVQDDFAKNYIFEEGAGNTLFWESLEEIEKKEKEDRNYYEKNLNKICQKFLNLGYTVDNESDDYTTFKKVKGDHLIQIEINYVRRTVTISLGMDSYELSFIEFILLTSCIANKAIMDEDLDKQIDNELDSLGDK